MGKEYIIRLEKIENPAKKVIYKQIVEVDDKEYGLAHSGDLRGHISQEQEEQFLSQLSQQAKERPDAKSLELKLNLQY